MADFFRALQKTQLKRYTICPTTSLWLKFNPVNHFFPVIEANLNLILAGVSLLSVTYNGVVSDYDQGESDL